MKRHCTSVKQRAVGKERCLLDRPGARARVFRVSRVCPGYRGRPRVPCVPCVSRLPPVSFYRYQLALTCGVFVVGGFGWL